VHSNGTNDGYKLCMKNISERVKSMVTLRLRSRNVQKHAASFSKRDGKAISMGLRRYFVGMCAAKPTRGLDSSSGTASWNFERMDRLAMFMRELGHQANIAELGSVSCVESLVDGVRFIVCPVADTPFAELHSIRFERSWPELPRRDSALLAAICNEFNEASAYVRACWNIDEGIVHLKARLDHCASAELTKERFGDLVDIFVRRSQQMNEPIQGLYRDAFSGPVAPKALCPAEQAGLDGEPPQSASWSRARAGCTKSMVRLGVAYREAGSFGESIPLATYLLTQAAMKRQVEAYYPLASVLAESAPEDVAALVEAAKFAILATLQLPGSSGDAVAEALRADLMLMLDSDDQEEAIALALDWASG
jgi:hypothetical protein